MKFNYNKLVGLFNASGEKKIDFARAIFGEHSRLGPDYFADKQKNITLEHLDRLAVHYHVHWTYFIDDDDKSSDTYNNVSKVISHNDVTNLNITEHGAMSKKTMEVLITTLQSVIADKNEEIKWIKTQWDNVLNTLKSLNK